MWCGSFEKNGKRRDSFVRCRAASCWTSLAEIEREFISLRTREALAKRKAAGLPFLGRPKGRKAARLKLDAQEADIRRYLAKGISKRSVAKLVECSPSTLYDWLARRNIRTWRQTAATRG